jgi:hypothetical protein
MKQSIVRSSFIRLYDNSSKIFLPIIPMREKQRISPPLIFSPGEILFFYIAYPVSGPLTLTDGSGNSFDGGATFTNVPTTIGDHTIMTVGVPEIPDNVYKMTIGGKESNYVEVVGDISLIDQISSFWKVRHNKILNNIYYPYTGSNFHQWVRLRMTMLDLQPETNIEGYEATNTGKQRNLQGVYKEYVTFQTPDYEIEDHQAMSLFTLHDHIEINGVEFIRRPSGTYKMSPSMDTPVSNGEFSLYDNSSTFLLRC